MGGGEEGGVRRKGCRNRLPYYKVIRAVVVVGKGGGGGDGGGVGGSPRSLTGIVS